MATCEDDLESTPLLAHDRHDSLKEDLEAETLAQTQTSDDWIASIDDPMTYTLSWLKGWQVFFILKKTVFDNPGLWWLLAKLMMLSAVVATATYNLMPDPQLLDASKFSAITQVLTLFVTLMLSFFLSSSVHRWIACVSGFLQLFNAIRNLAMQLHALGADPDHIRNCLRYGVLSAKFLIQDLRAIQMSDEKKKESAELMWRQLSASNKAYSVKAEEKAIIEHLQDKPGQMWMWVGSLIGRMALDGDVPAMATPTYGRIMNLAQEAQHGLRQVRTSIIVQMPFVYVHTLAVLVHVNSILLAVNMGLAAGVTIHGIRQYCHHYYYTEHPDPSIKMEPLTAQIQCLIVEVTKGILGPLLYQAFFEIGVSVASPFSGEHAAIPVARLTKALEQDLEESFIMAEQVPHWKRPKFSPPKA